MEGYMVKILDKGTPDFDRMVAFAETCSWEPGRNLALRMKEGTVSDGTDGAPKGAIGKRGTEWEILIGDFGEDGSPRGFGVLSSSDFPPVDYLPWVGVVFVGEEFRGQRISQRLIEVMEEKAKELGYKVIYLVTDHVNLYEKYGYEKFDTCACPWDENQVESLYKKEL